MGYFQNKKSAASGFLVMILIITAGFAIIFMIIPLIVQETDIAAADSICKASVALRAKTYTEISPGIGPVDVDIAEFGTPLLCKTSELILPEDKTADKEAIQKELAGLIVSCWNRYGEGLIENVFKTTGSKAKNRCQVCYIVNLRETTNFQGEPSEEQTSNMDDIFTESKPLLEEIRLLKIEVRNNREVVDNQIKLLGVEEKLVPLQERLAGITEGIGGVYPDEFGDYLFNTPYKLISESDDCKIDGGFCIKSTDDMECRDPGVFPDEDIRESDIIIDETSAVCKNKVLTSCCFTDYECLNRGGICDTSNPDVDKYRDYDEWECPFISPSTSPPQRESCYVEKENHFTYGEYVQSFGGEGRTMVLAGIYPGETYAISFGSPSDKCGWCDWAKGAGAIAGASAVLVGGSLLLGGGIIAAPFTFGSSLAITAIGVGVLVGGGVGYSVGAAGSSGIYSVMEHLRDRDMNTVYFSTLEQIQTDDLCSIIKSV